jgi:hypothetical protein
MVPGTDSVGDYVCLKAGQDAGEERRISALVRQKSAPSFLPFKPSNSLSFINFTYQGLQTIFETRIIINSDKIKVICSKHYEMAVSHWTEIRPAQVSPVG